MTKTEEIRKSRIGEINKNRDGLEMKIIEYTEEKNIMVEFTKSKSQIKTRYCHFKEGTTTDPYNRNIEGIGYIGIGKYKSSYNRKHSIEYAIWINMLKRCYNQEYQKKYPLYIGCTVIDEWHNYQNFAKWYNENYYKVKEQRMELDKDILVKGNKVYSPETCVFVPRNINCLFTKRDRFRGDFPIGVYYRKDYNKYSVSCNNGYGKCIFLGYYYTEQDAFTIYKKYKENLIKEIADKYKGQIPQKLYEALYRYQVEITD